MAIYYIYFHFRLDNGDLFYVGKGKDYRYKVKTGRNKDWKDIVDKYGYKPVIIKDGLTEEESFKLEKIYIDKYKNSLVNKCNSGTNLSTGYKHTEEAKIKIGEYNKTKRDYSKVGEKISKSKKGVKFSEEHKVKLSDSKKGYIVSDETKEKIAHYNRTKRDYSKVGEKISKSLKGHIVSDETKEKISKSLKGHIPWNKGLKFTDKEKEK